MSSMKEVSISQYITAFDFKSNWTLKSIKENLQTILGETPAVETIYEKDAFLN